MRPDIVADIGNTRIKWGLVEPGQSDLARIASLADDPGEWQTQIDLWACLPGNEHRGEPLRWVVASVSPARTDRLRQWVEARGDRFFHLRGAAQLPLRVNLEHPDWAGIDRLLNAVAALTRLEAGRPAVLIGAGSAVTLDWLDEEHIFQGGAIFPGIDLMAQALNRYTALLPLVQVALPIPDLPGKGTIPAMQAGIVLAAAGGIREAVRIYSKQAKVLPRVFFTGGQAPLLARAMGLCEGASLPPPWEDCLLWPEQTLVGILRSVEAVP
jgi:type III pantothenate kinase